MAAAAPAVAASAATASITATLTSVATNMLTNIAISAVMAALQPQVGAAGRTNEWLLSPDGPIPFAAGRIGVPGSTVHKDTFGPDLMYYGIPSVLSGAGPIDGFESFTADDEPVTFDATGKATSSQYAGELWYKNSHGAQPATAITSPTGLKNGATLPGWTSAHKLSGLASYMIVMGENSKGSAFPTGEIKPMVTFRGLKVYDPRLDSTYPGGSGAHRLATPSTWTFSSNPALWALKWTLGLWAGPTGKGAPQVDYQVGGIGAKLSGIDVPAFVAAANVCDANSWTVAAYPTTDDDKAQVLDSFLQAAGATYAQRAGKVSLIQRAAPRTSIVTISGRDTAGPLEIDTAASRIDRINTIRPRYWAESARWQMLALPEVTASAYQTQDGGKRTRGIDYTYVSDPVQAAQLAALQIANTREGIAGIIPLKPHLQRIRPGDAFTITEEDFVLNGVKCLCLNTDYDPETGVVRVSFVSETDAKYPFAMGQSPDVPVPPVLTPVDTRYVGGPLPDDWTVTLRPPATGGTQLPGLDLTGLVSNLTATAILIEYGPTGTGPWKQAYQGPPTVTNVPIDGLQPGASYYIAVSYQRDSNYSQRQVYGPFTAPELVAGDISPGGSAWATIVDRINEALAEFDPAGAIGDQLNALEAADDALQASLAAIDTDLDGLASVVSSHTSQIAGKALITDLNAQIARINGVEAVNATQNTALVDLSLNKAEASSLTTTQAEIANARDGQSSLLAKLQAMRTAQVGDDSALATLISNVTARTANTEADIVDLEIAQANESLARAQAIQQVTARSAHRDNLLPNGGFERGTEGITAVRISDGVTISLGIGIVDGPNGRCLNIGPYGAGLYVIEWPDFVVYPDDAYTLTGDAAVFSIGSVDQTYFDLQMRGPSGEDLGPAGDGGQTIQFGSRDFALANRDAYAVTTTTPSGAGRARARFVINCATAPTLIQLRQVKAERGAAPPTAYSAEQADRALSASVTSQSLAVIDLELQQAVARWNVRTAAVGSKPTVLELLSGYYGSAIAMTAEQIYFGDNTVFDDATDTLTTTIGSVRYITAWGAPFGSDSLTHWVGPTSVGPAGATKANAEAVGGQWRDNTGDSLFGGKTLSGPFDSGTASATEINLPKNVWTTVATVDRGMQTAGYLMGRVPFDIRVTGASGGDDDYGFSYRIAVTNADGAGLVEIAGNFATGLPNAWLAQGGAQGTLLEGAVTLASRGMKKIILQINPTGANIATATARNGRLRGLYGA
jgi:hypothetical protein